MSQTEQSIEVQPIPNQGHLSKKTIRRLGWTTVAVLLFGLDTWAASQVKIESAGSVRAVSAGPVTVGGDFDRSSPNPGFEGRIGPFRAGCNLQPGTLEIENCGAGRQIDDSEMP